MLAIDNFLNKFLEAYNSGNKEEYSIMANRIISEIDYDEKQFSYTKHSYMAATALYYLFLQDEKPLPEEKKTVVMKLIYVCLINNFLDNKDVASSDPKYLDLVGGSQLAVIVLLQNPEFFMSELITTVGYMPDYAKKILFNMVRLFGGIVKDANERNIHHKIEDKLFDYFESLYKEMYPGLPTGANLMSFKEGAIPVLKNITSYIQMTFKEPDDVFF